MTRGLSNKLTGAGLSLMMSFAYHKNKVWCDVRLLTVSEITMHRMPTTHITVQSGHAMTVDRGFDDFL
jgi:hypothetical protein